MTMDCMWCHYKKPGHDQACPEVLTTEANRKCARAVHEQGYRAGRSGVEASSTDPTYLLGHLRGKR